MGERLTDKLIKALQAPSSSSKIYYDDGVKGLGVRVTATGAKAFILRYRIGGRGRLFTIGSFPDWSTSAAREEAKALKRRIDRGEDPMGERHEERGEPTIDCLCDRYLSESWPRTTRPARPRKSAGSLIRRSGRRWAS
jgi:Arm DNA-binding domain